MKPPQATKTVAIVGNGRMGTGISQVFASHGMEVRLIGRSEESLARAIGTIESNLAEFVGRQVMSESDAAAALARVTTGTDFGAAEGADHVIEAVPAQRALQIEVFGRLDEVCAPEVVIGSTSGQPISLMVERMKHPERAVAMHFVFPAQLITLVEVCGGEKTAPEVVAWACDLLKSIGYTPAVMNKEVDGFIINRLQFAILREAWSMWANGIASAQAIDDSFKLTLGRRYSVTGPIESAELGGLKSRPRHLQPWCTMAITDLRPAKGFTIGLRKTARLCFWRGLTGSFSTRPKTMPFDLSGGARSVALWIAHAVTLKL
jgi:3-hydroxybutyryl-CoA dehydrogenase